MEACTGKEEERDLLITRLNTLVFVVVVVVVVVSTSDVTYHPHSSCHAGEGEGSGELWEGAYLNKTVSIFEP